MYVGFACFCGRDRTKAVQKVETYWGQDDDTIASYSVRSGFDLLLQALELDEGDEIIFSALNIKGMMKVVHRLGLVPVPADLDIDYFGPRLETLEAAITPKSKVLVVAHLFGSRIDMVPIVAFARKHNLILVEDLPQAFDGHAYPGAREADVKMFSFGPLKTATALNGALIRVNDEKLRNRMRDLLKGVVVLPGLANKVHSYWIFTMMVDEPHTFIKKLRALGFDCGDMPRSQAVKAPADRPEISPIVSDTSLKDMIMVPCYPGMPKRELVRLADAIKKIADETGTERTKTFARTLQPVISHD